MSEAYQLILRLDQPPDHSLRFSESIDFKAWFLAPEKWDRQDFKPRLVIEESHVPALCLRDFSVLAGNFLKREASDEIAYIEAINVSGDSLEIEGIDPQGKGFLYEISGRINIAALIPKPGAPNRVFFLVLIASLEEHFTVSNILKFGVAARQEWSKPYGGFVFPNAPSLRSDFLILEGWAFCSGDKLQEVALTINDVNVGAAKINLWSPVQQRALPDVIESRECGFSKTLFWKELEILGLSAGVNGLKLHVTAECVFESGLRYQIAAPTFNWQPKGKSKRLKTCNSRICSPGIYGEIEGVKRDIDGWLVVDGWVLSEKPESIQLYLEGARKLTLLSEVSNPMSELEWNQRPDIEMLNLLQAFHTRAGFKLRIHPQILTRFPGFVRLIAVGEEGNYQSCKSVVIGPLGQLRKLSQLLAADASYKNLGEIACASLLSLGGLIDLRRQVFRAASLIKSRIETRRSSGSGAGKHFPGRILFASHNLSDVEGAPRVLFNIAKFFSEQEKLQAWVVSAQDGPLRSAFEVLGIEVSIIPELSTYQQSWERYSRGLHHCVQKIRETKPELIFANVIDTFWAVDAAYRMNLPSLWGIHESVDPLSAFPELDPRLRLQFLDRLTVADRLIFVAEQTREIFSKYLETNRSLVIPNGVDCERIKQLAEKSNRPEIRSSLGVQEDEILISIVGTTTFRKGQDIFISEMASLTKLLPETKFKFFIVGARYSDYLIELEQLVANFGLGDITVFVPETPEVSQFFIAADIMVVASRAESAPLVSLETMAYERPLVSSTVFGLAEQILPEQNALSFELDCPGSLAEQLKRLIEEPELGLSLSAFAKQDVSQRFDLRHSMEKYRILVETIYKEAYH